MMIIHNLYDFTRIKGDRIIFKCKESIMPFVVLVVCCLSFLSCKDLPNRDKNCYDDILLGRTLPIIDSTYQASNGKGQLTLICSPYDCQPCLDVAFEEISEIRKDYPDVHLSIISVLDAPSSIQIKYSFYDYIPFDGEDIVRKALKFVPTPTFIVSDSHDVIVGYHFPRKEDNIKACVKHIEKSLYP